MTLFYLSMDLQSQAGLVRHDQVDDGFQDGPQESVDAKHQGAELLGERWGNLETMEKRRMITTNEMHE